MNLFERIARLTDAHATFAIATVVARRSPVSSHIGDRALVFPDGRMEGFVGGSCSRDIVRRQAVEAIRSRRPRLLQIRPEADPSGVPPDAERVVVPMSCSSEGAVDVYIEPCVPRRRLVIAGYTPVAVELVRLASQLEYDVVHALADDELRDAVAPGGVRQIALGELRALLDELSDGDRASLLAVVASQGHYDEAALETLLAYGLGFVGLLASRRRAANVFGVLRQMGVDAGRVASVHNPVGLDIGARNPGEVAISVLAEIIAHGARAEVRAPSTPPEERDATPSAALDPICGMEVDVATARHRFEHEGTVFAFCCAGCRETFAADPARHLAAAGTP